MSESPLYKTVVVRQSITCSSPQETQYYSAKKAAFIDRCYYCGLTEPLVDNDEMKELKERYASVRPLCVRCKAEGKQPETRGEKNVGKRQRRK
jgi:hypothetical protein